MALINGQNFSASERLKSRKDIEELFKQGSSFYLFPFVVKYLFTSEENEAVMPGVLISVPRKKFKKAVTRNSIRRKIREAYRLNKYRLLKQERIPDKLAFIYVAREEKGFSLIQDKLTAVLNRFKKI